MSQVGRLGSTGSHKLDNSDTLCQSGYGQWIPADRRKTQMNALH